MCWRHDFQFQDLFNGNRYFLIHLSHIPCRVFLLRSLCISISLATRSRSARVVGGWPAGVLGRLRSTTSVCNEFDTTRKERAVTITNRREPARSASLESLIKPTNHLLYIYNILIVVLVPFRCRRPCCSWLSLSSSSNPMQVSKISCFFCKEGRNDIFLSHVGPKPETIRFLNGGRKTIVKNT